MNASTAPVIAGLGPVRAHGARAALASPDFHNPDENLIEVSNEVA